MDGALVFGTAATPNEVGLVGEFSAAVGGQGVIRVDWAWPLFFPDSWQGGVGDLPDGNPRTQWRLMADWIRLTLSRAVAGVHPSPVIAWVPPLTATAEEWLTRQFSFYTRRLGIWRLTGQEAVETLLTEWSAFVQGSPSGWVDGWTPPVIRPWDSGRHPMLFKSVKKTPTADFVYLGGMLGSDRLAVQTYRIKPGGVANRNHAHSDVDECYLVWEGSGTLRIGERTIPVVAGDVVAKPSGSRLALAFEGGPDGLVVFDVEGWRHFSQTDVVIYPDHGEWYLRGPGLETACAEESLFDGTDVMAHYSERYWRDRGNSRQPRDEKSS